MLSKEHAIFRSRQKPTSCILALPGRGQYGGNLASAWVGHGLDKTLIIGITPRRLEWYPMPFSPMDQSNAVAGLEIARNAIEDFVNYIIQEYGIPKSKIALTGFSAGGVMSIYTAAHSEEAYAGVVCLAGAILEPQKLPEARFKDVPFILTHSQDDEVFEWGARYLPMKNALEEKGYNCILNEKSYGNHTVGTYDIGYSALMLADAFDYSSEWKKQKANHLEYMESDELSI